MATYCVNFDSLDSMAAYPDEASFYQEHTTLYPQTEQQTSATSPFPAAQFVPQFPGTRSSLPSFGRNNFYSSSCGQTQATAPHFSPQHQQLSRLKLFQPISLHQHQQQQQLSQFQEQQPPVQADYEFVQRLLESENNSNTNPPQTFQLDVSTTNLLEPTTTAHYNPSSSPPASPEMNYTHAENTHNGFERPYGHNNLMEEVQAAGISSDSSPSAESHMTIYVPSSDPVFLKSLGLERKDTTFAPYKDEGQSLLCIGLSDDSFNSDDVDEGTLFSMLEEPLYTGQSLQTADNEGDYRYPNQQSIYAEESSFPSSPPLSSPVLYNYPYAHIKAEVKDEEDEESDVYTYELDDLSSPIKRVYKTRSGRGSVKRRREDDYCDDGDADYCDDYEDEDDDDDYFDEGNQRSRAAGTTAGRKLKCAKVEKSSRSHAGANPMLSSSSSLLPLQDGGGESEEEAIASLYPLSNGSVALSDVLRRATSCAANVDGEGKAKKRHAAAGGKGKKKHAAAGIPLLNFPAKFPPEWKLLVSMEAVNSVDYDLDRFLRIQRIDMRSLEHEPRGDELRAKISDVLVRYRGEMEKLDRVCEAFKRPFATRVGGAAADDEGQDLRSLGVVQHNDGGYDPDDSPRRRTRRSAQHQHQHQQQYQHQQYQQHQRHKTTPSPVVDAGKAKELVRTMELKFEYLRVELRQNVCEAIVMLYKQHMDAHASSSSSSKIERGALTKKRRKRRGSFNESVKKTLIEWFNANANHPYPSKEEVMILAAKADLTINQVSGWFSNWRAREKRRAEEEGGASPVH